MNPFDDDFKKQYELARRIGERRFGSPCKHELVKNGQCQRCLRKVYTGKQK